MQQKLADASAEAERAITAVRTLRLFAAEGGACAVYDRRVLSLTLTLTLTLTLSLTLSLPLSTAGV